MRCEEFLSLLPMVPDELPTDAAEAFRRHAEECAPCERALKQHHAMLSMLRSLDDDLEVPAEWNQRWKSATGAREGSGKNRNAGIRNRVMGLAASVILVLGTALMREGVIFQKKENTVSEPISFGEPAREEWPSSDVVFLEDPSNTMALEGGGAEADEGLPAQPYASSLMEWDAASAPANEYDDAHAPPEAVFIVEDDVQGMEPIPAERGSTPLFKRAKDAFLHSMRVIPDFLADLLVFISYIAPYAACAAIISLLIAIIFKIKK